MMKKWMLPGLIALFMGCNGPKENEFIIQGTISSYPADVLIIAYQNNGDFALDTIRIDGGKLSYTKQLTDTIVATLVSRDPHSNIPLENGMIIPGECVTVFMTPGTAMQLDIDNSRWPEMRIEGGGSTTI